MALYSPLPVTAAQTATTDANAQQERHDVDIASQPLPQALAQLSQLTHLQVLYTQDEPYGITAPAIKGRYSDAEALNQLLAGSGFTWRQVRPGAITLERTPAVAAKSAVTLGTLSVSGAAANESRDERGHNDVYDQDISSTYMGKQEIERYKGNNPADVLKGMVGVFSGDARNSGALDPSIRGVEGPGRVPVIIDGTEQALTVWRGYNGSANRSYIDPSLMGGIQVLKGPSMTRDVDTGIGGAVVAHTLNVSDILNPGQTFGGEIKIEGGDNAVGPRLPQLLSGQDYRTVPGFPGSPGTPGTPYTPYADPTLRENLKHDGDNKTFSLGDKAYRVALAGRDGDFDWLAAYAYRKRGNYFSGDNEPDYYADKSLSVVDQFHLIRVLGLSYKPGDEVPNTSSQMDSWLLKGTWHIADDQSLQLGLRDSLVQYGEIMPSRIFLSGNPDIGAIQWPLSKVDNKAYNLDYKWQPDSPWIDFHANLWTTRTASHTYSAGGFPNFALGSQATTLPNLDLPAGFNPNLLYNTALSDSQDNLIGLTLSNKMRLADNLDLTLGNDWKYEKLTSPDQWTGYDGWRAYPRAGRRVEYDAHFNFEWRPVDFLTLNAGMRYAGYWAHDDFLGEQIRVGNGGNFVTGDRPYETLGYQVMHTPTADEVAQTIALAQSAIQTYTLFGQLGIFPPDVVAGFIKEAQQTIANAANPAPKTEVYNWNPDSQGHYSRATNICLNPALQPTNFINGSCTRGNPTDVPTTFVRASDKSHHGQGWTPALAATVNFTENSRVYLRYNEMYRFPSLFESTLGFSASIPLTPLKPEHAYAFEAGYVHDLRDLLHLDGEHRADVKLSYYHTETRNVIDRTVDLQFHNLDKQVISGLELQGRYDNGRFFTDLGLAHMLKDKVCDESTAVQMDPVQGRVPNCVNYGFIASYLFTQATPKDSINWTLGARFLDRKLEIGTRAVYYRAYSNAQANRFVSQDQIAGYGLNVPYTWGTIVTLDGYADYRLNDHVTVELTGTNLNNRYYIDPDVRALMPAPGRTLRASVTARF